MNNPNLADRQKYYNKGIDDFINAILESRYAKGFACCDFEYCTCCQKIPDGFQNDEYYQEEYNNWLRCKNGLEKELIKIKESM